MLAGDLYIADDPELERLQEEARRLQEAYHRAHTAADGTAPELLRRLLGHVGDGVEVRPPLYVDYGSNVSIGAGSFVNYNLMVLDVAAVTIGQDCLIGPNVQLLTPTHPVEAEPRRAKLEAAAPITIEDNVWLGGGVIVCPGVTIGNDSVIGAGAVVTKDVPAGVVAVGNPARVIRPI
ncbi:sugar O-acetyltransferase [Georgenia sp. Z1344]|uniref:sugar O-acetyltransferase n=1 Tax=Georgenia sp. Z1344 TaxID=3416706 RepID=UPI003CFB64CB